MPDDIGRFDETHLNADWLGSLRLQKKYNKSKDPQEKLMIKRELAAREQVKLRPLDKEEKSDIAKRLSE